MTSPAQSRAPRRSILGTVSRLTLVHIAIAICALLTAPLLARALGPAGRGDLAAILVPLGLAPLLLDLGLGVYASREAARRDDIGSLIGTVGLMLLVISLLGVAVSVPVANLLAGGRDTVEIFITVGLCLLPLGVLTNLLNGVALGLERWGAVFAVRLIPPVGTLLIVVPLYVLDRLTVATAAATVILVSVFAIVPVIAVVRRAGRLRWDRDIARESVPFGLKSWGGSLATIANFRLDQLLMIRLVEPRVLGLYAVAVTLAAVPSTLIKALSGGVFPRIAAGETELVPRILRITLLVTASGGVLLAAICEPLLVWLLGPGFADAALMTQVLLAAELSRSGVGVLSSSLTASGAPGVTATAQAIGLALTVPLLVVLVPTLGGEGAALASLIAYSATFAYLVVGAKRRLGGGLRDYVIPTASDLQDLVQGGQRAVVAARRRLRPRATAA